MQHLTNCAMRKLVVKIYQIAIAIVLCAALCATGTKISAVGDLDIVFCRSREPTKKIALTFDDGPHPRFTERILKILDKYGVKATFFVIGVNIQNYPEPLKKIYAAGHEIGNHSYSHDNVKDLDASTARVEMEKCEQVIRDTVGISTSVFRPPRGACNPDVLKSARELGYSVVLWSIDTLDWKGTSPLTVFKTVNGQISGGDIILMHDYTSGSNAACEALDSIIPELIAKGYEFVTVSELIGAS